MRRAGDLPQPVGRPVGRRALAGEVGLGVDPQHRRPAGTGGAGDRVGRRGAAAERRAGQLPDQVTVNAAVQRRVVLRVRRHRRGGLRGARGDQLAHAQVAQRRGADGRADRPQRLAEDLVAPGLRDERVDLGKGQRRIPLRVPGLQSGLGCVHAVGLRADEDVRVARAHDVLGLLDPRYKSRLRPRSPRSIPATGRSLSPRTVRGPWPVPASTP
jgi:hypothetical protein